MTDELPTLPVELTAYELGILANSLWSRGIQVSTRIRKVMDQFAPKQKRRGTPP